METSTAELAQEGRNRATQARIAAKEVALIAEAQPHLPSGAVQAGDTTTAARAEAQQSTPEAAQQVYETAEHTKGVAEHAASTAHARGPGTTGSAYDAVTPLRANVEETTVAFSSEAASSPSSAGPPSSPTDTQPVHGVGGGVWDPARGIDIFKKKSEEVLSRFLKMGSWEEEEEEQSPGQSPAS